MCVCVCVCVCVCKSHGKLCMHMEKSMAEHKQKEKGESGGRRERGVGEESLTPVVLCELIDCNIALSSPSFRLAL